VKEERNMRRPLLLAAALALAPAAAFAGDAIAIAAKPALVEIHNMKFSPASLTIAVGTTVTWLNEDDQPHTVTARSGVFRSAALDTKESFSYTFNAPGDFAYSCAIHPFMVGQVTVKPAGRL
jgi:plastocyanin